MPEENREVLFKTKSGYGVSWEPMPCLGLMGKLFGHKFTKFGWTNPGGSCYRCGKAPEK